MTDFNIYLPYPSPQSISELEADVNAILAQPGVPTSLTNEVYAVEQSPTTQDNINEAEANSDSTANE
jgi:hypothetical protein